MSASGGGSFSQMLRDLLLRLSGSGSVAAPHNPARPPAGAPAPVPTLPGAGEMLSVLEPRVLMIIYNPVVNAASGRKLIEFLGWNDPDQLAAGYIADVKECSGGLVNYQIVDRIEANEIPVKADGFQYKPGDLANCYRAGFGFHDPDGVDYPMILAKFNLVERIENNEFDEVWLFGGPFFGFYESTMAGEGAFWCNGPVVPQTQHCRRRFVVMGFNYERGVGEMLEDLGHRTESILAHVFGSEAAVSRAYDSSRIHATLAAPANLFERFIAYDGIAPGQANVGVLHYAPNSLQDYDWGNPAPVLSCCDDWLLFPNLPEPPTFRTVDARDWGNGDIRQHHKWWFERLPKAAGETNRISNNWWKYAIDVNQAQ